MGYCKGLNNYQHVGPMFRIQLQHHMPQIHLKIVLVIIRLGIHIYVYMALLLESLEPVGLEPPASNLPSV